MLLLTLLLATLAGEGQAAMRCGGDLIQRGDRTFDVERLCGEPDLREPLELSVAGGTVSTSVERWYYNGGPQRLIRMVDFHDGRVTRLHAGGYGYSRFPGSRCDARLLRRGMTRMELLGECGPPDARQTITPGIGATPDGPVSVPVREEWLYDYGTGHIPRIVTLERGRVTRVEQGRRRR